MSLPRYISFESNARQVPRHLLAGMVAAVISVLLLQSPISSGQQVNSATAVSRECTTSQGEMHGKRPPKPSKRKSPPQIELVPVCSEVKDSALAAQEYLQKYVREQRWSLSDEQVSEDMWTFSLDLSKDELLRYAKLSPDARIDWSGAKALINVRTTSLDDGYARVIVTLRLDAYGEPEDKFVPRPKSWPVPSSGTLEATLLSALRAHLEAVR